MSTFRPKSFNTYAARHLPKSVSSLLSKPKPPQWAISLARRKAEQFDRWRRDDTPFLVGQKKVYLPKFTVALLRTPDLSPHWAKFEVPLYFNKLDMRDYLFHAYNVNTKSIRSFIPPVRVERRLRLTKPGQRRRYRPKGVKRMTVELEQPFVWPPGPNPEKPEDWKPWDRDRYREIMERQGNDEQVQSAKSRKRFERRRVRSHESYDTEERSELRRLADDLLSGRKRWGEVDPSTLPDDVEGKSLPHR
ncbi:MAG: hypothetical protein Q9162_004559 [Coniocarpon cinnabarinum]